MNKKAQIVIESIPTFKPWLLLLQSQYIHTWIYFGTSQIKTLSSLTESYLLCNSLLELKFRVNNPKNIFRLKFSSFGATRNNMPGFTKLRFSLQSSSYTYNIFKYTEKNK